MPKRALLVYNASWSLSDATHNLLNYRKHHQIVQSHSSTCDLTYCTQMNVKQLRKRYRPDKEKPKTNLESGMDQPTYHHTH